MASEAKDIFEATSRSFREMLSENGLGLYIPAYQRPYGWERSKVDRLLDDTLHGIRMLIEQEESFTFLGTVITIHDIHYLTVSPMVRGEVPGKVLTVIDGQQRLCTLLLLAVSLHSQLRTKHRQVFKGSDPDGDDIAMSWVNDEALKVVNGLGTTIYERQASGTSPLYPRIIRAFDDQWSKKDGLARYESPIARLLSLYSQVVDSDEIPKDFRLKAREDAPDGEGELIRRFSEITSALRSLARTGLSGELEELPSLSEISDSRRFQLALLNHEFPQEVKTLLRGEIETPGLKELLRLIVIGAYVLNRIAVTVVKGKNEDYAFTIFESLNTTGEPLTAFETFKPRVVNAEGLSNYESSRSRHHIDAVSSYLACFRSGTQLQNRTKDLLVWFALAETGDKLAKRLPDQRSYLKDQYERHEPSEDGRVGFIRHLKDTASFTRHCWERPDGEELKLPGLPSSASSDAFKLCLSFLKDLGHSIALPPLVRFYAAALLAQPEERTEKIADLEAAAKAITAFSVLWRAANRGTAGIDGEYRDIMAGLDSQTGLAPLARMLRRPTDEGKVAAPTVDVNGLKSELRARLSARAGITDRATWVALARMLPMYGSSTDLSRFILLAAYHDTVEDPAAPGLIKRGKDGSSECFTYKGWQQEVHLTLEHVAPQTQSATWDDSLYADKEVIDRVGNLVLTPRAANSSLGNRSWSEKRVQFAALGAPTQEQARAILEQAAAEGLKFSTFTETLVENSRHMPHLSALGQRLGEWDTAFIDERSTRMLELAWDRLSPWLGLNT